MISRFYRFFFFQAEDGIRDYKVTGVQTCALPIFFICFGVIGGLGNGFGYATPIPVMAKWFPDKRGLAVGLAVAGYGGGSALFGPFAHLKLIPAYCVHTPVMILGVVFLFINVVGAVLLHN